MTRFVLLTTPRCGASLLITALNQNPAIACAGQKLAVYGEGPDHFPARLALPGFWDDSHWAGTAAVGFHARLHHLDDDDWDYLLRQDVSFVLLSRVDLMSFLDAWPSGLTLDVQTQRQAQRPWIEQITNWDEILEDARGTALYHTLSRNPIDRLLRGAVVSRAADPIPGNEVLIA
jgi:hypothetical protein